VLIITSEMFVVIIFVKPKFKNKKTYMTSLSRTSSSASLPSPSAKKRKTTEIKYSCEDIVSKLAVVHATNILPVDDMVMKAGTASRADPSKEYFRPTIHFALGELIRDVIVPRVEPHTWNKKRFAIIMPFKQLLESKQVASVNCYDTIVVGNFAVPDENEVILLIPEGEFQDVDFGRRSVIAYDPNKEDFRSKIKSILLEHKYWDIELYDNRGQHQLLPADLMEQDQPVNINSAKFFQPVIDHYWNPLLCFGSHYYSPTNSCLFGRIEQASTRLLSRQYPDHDELFDQFIKEAQRIIESDLGAFPEISLKTFQDQYQKLHQKITQMSKDFPKGREEYSMDESSLGRYYLPGIQHSKPIELYWLLNSLIYFPPVDTTDLTQFESMIKKYSKDLGGYFHGLVHSTHVDDLCSVRYNEVFGWYNNVLVSHNLLSLYSSSNNAVRITCNIISSRNL
jgi:hypothetical protein